MKLTPDEKRRLAEELVEVNGLDPVDEQTLFMDSHGCNVMLMVVRHGSKLMAFTYRQSSEESFYDDDPAELVDVVPELTQVMVWKRADGDDWNEHL